jgi:4-methyl-5(b-hydroxyethyl)-thiazole monophosphate biosynthesis
MSTPRVLVPLAPGFEEIETVTPIDILRRAGAEVVIASVDGAPWVVGRTGIVIRADRTLDDVRAEAFNLVLIPGGPAVAALRKDVRIHAMLQTQHREQGWIGAICAAPLVLKDAGILPDHYSAHDSCLGELPQAQIDTRVVVAGRTITSRGAGTSLDFAFALVAALFGHAKEDEVRRAILA